MTPAAPVVEVPVVVRIADPESVLRCYSVQRALEQPVHLWFECPLSLPLCAEEKRRVLDRLEAAYGREPRSRWARHPSHARRQGNTIREILEMLLEPSERRCFTPRRAGRFHRAPIETGVDRTALVPFAGEWFLVTNSRCLLGRGSFADVLARGEVVRTYESAGGEERGTAAGRAPRSRQAHRT